MTLEPCTENDYGQHINGEATLNKMGDWIAIVIRTK